MDRAVKPPVLDGWNIRMGAEERQTFHSALSESPALVRAITSDFAARTTVVTARATRCGGGATCASGRNDGSGARTYLLEFLPTDLDRSSASQFLVLHELGHLVDFDGIDRAAMAAFMDAFRASPDWRPCFRAASGECVDQGELFADQFALYASGRTQSLTWYRTPRLLTTDHFEYLLRAHYRR